jgi:KaiC/GvpD/RAD55 family RecA-like ATPase
MSDERSIVAACAAKREAYEAFKIHGALQDLSPLGQHWISAISDYYGRDKLAGSTDIKLVREMGLHAADERHADVLSAYYDDLPIVGVSASNVVAHILELQRYNLGIQLASMLQSPEVDRLRIREVIEHYQDVHNAVEVGLKKVEYLDFDDLEQVYDPAHIVPLYPKRLKQQCLGGGAMPGHHVLIYGRPEAGKSLTAIHISAGALHNGKRVLYCGNEESVRTIGIRLACNLARKNIRDYQSSAGVIRAAADKRNLHNAHILELKPGTFAEIEAGIQDCQPDLVVVDQLPGIDVGESNPVRGIDKAARSFRTLLQKHAVVGLSVSQAGDRTERHGQIPPAYLTMSDVYGSRTGLPAQADLMIGVGYDQDMYDRNIRAFSLPKNKIGGSHESFKCHIDVQQSRLRSL